MRTNDRRGKIVAAESGKSDRCTVATGRTAVIEHLPASPLDPQETLANTVKSKVCLGWSAQIRYPNRRPTSREKCKARVAPLQDLDGGRPMDSVTIVNRFTVHKQ